MSLIGEAFVRIRPDDTGFKAEATRQVKRDLASVERSAASSNRELGRFSRGTLAGTGALAGLGRAAAFASTAFIGGAGLAVALKSTVSAAEQAQAVQAQLVNALEQQNIALKGNVEAIDKRSLALANMSGFDDELLKTTFVNFVRRTGDVTKALQLNEIAVNVARGRNISLEASAALVTRASLGMAGALRRVGIAAENGASATELLDLLQRKYAGSAEAYGKTAAGAQERFKVALQNTQEVIGSALLPAITNILTKATDWLNNSKNQERIQRDVNRAVEVGTGVVGKLGRTYDVATESAGKFAGALERINNALGGGGVSEQQKKNQAWLEKIIADYKALLALPTIGDTIADLFNISGRPAPTSKFFFNGGNGIPASARGHGFVGRPLTAAEIVANALAVNPDDVKALQAQRAQYQKALDYAQTQVDSTTGNTAQWAKDIATQSDQIRQINEHLAQIVSDNAAKAEKARLAAIAKLIPNQIGGRGFAGSAFARLQALIAGRIPGQVSGGGGPVDVSALVNQSQAQREASLRTQIAEQTVTNEKKLIPYLQDELAADRAHLALLKKIGASKEDQLQEQLNIAQTKNRIRDILHTDNQQDAFSIQALFGEGGNQFAAYGSNVGALTQPLSRQEAGGATVRAGQALAGRPAVIVTQNFFGERNASQALWEAQNAARATK